MILSTCLVVHFSSVRLPVSYSSVVAFPEISTGNELWTTKNTLYLTAQFAEMNR